MTRKEYLKEYHKAYRLKNKDKKKEVNRLYRLNNKEFIKQYQKHYGKEYYLKNKDKKKKLNRLDYFKNKDKKKELNRLYHLKNLDKVKQYKRLYQLNKPHIQRALNAKRKSCKLKATPTFADLNKIKEIYKNCPIGYHVDHIVPLQGKNVCGLHVEWNLQYLTASDNHTKSNNLN